MTKSFDITSIETFSTAGRDFHHETVHISTENAFVNVCNQKMLEAINDEMCVVQVIDILLKTIASQRIKETLDRNQTDTGGLSKLK